VSYFCTVELFCCCLVVSTVAINCLERLVPEMTSYVSSGTLNPIHSLAYLCESTASIEVNKTQFIAVICNSGCLVSQGLLNYLQVAVFGTSEWPISVSLCVTDIRTEAVMQALALNKKQSVIPMPSKRTSAAYSQNKPATAADHVSGES